MLATTTITTHVDPGDGFERTALVMPIDGDPGGSIDVLAPDNELFARINLFWFGTRDDSTRGGDIDIVIPGSGRVLLFGPPGSVHRYDVPDAPRKIVAVEITMPARRIGKGGCCPDVASPPEAGSTL